MCFKYGLVSVVCNHKQHVYWRQLANVCCHLAKKLNEEEETAHGSRQLLQNGHMQPT